MAIMLEDVGDAYETIDHAGTMPVVDAIGDPWLLFSGEDAMVLQGVPQELDDEKIDHGQVAIDELPSERWPLTLLVPVGHDSEIRAQALRYAAGYLTGTSGTTAEAATFLLERAASEAES